MTLPDKAYLTVFDDFSSPRPGTADLVFSASPNQSDVRRSPIIHYVEVDEPAPPFAWLSGVVVLGGTVLVLAVVFGVWRDPLAGAAGGVMHGRQRPGQARRTRSDRRSSIASGPSIFDYRVR